MSIRTIGKHRISCGDIHDKNIIAELLKGVSADIFYCDPPWGEGAIKMFDTMNKKMTGAESTGQFDNNTFLGTLLQYAKKHTTGFVVIEYGKRWVDAVIQIAASLGLHFCGKVETLYGGKPYKMEVLVFHVKESKKVNLKFAYHTKDGNTPPAIFECLYGGQSEGKTVIDLCCGLGNTAKAALSHKMVFIGNELNQSRLDRTIKLLENGKG